MLMEILLRSELKERFEVLFAMWDNEKIFSIGDLEEPREEYDEFIKSEYSGNIKERYVHVLEMLERLEYEKYIILFDFQ